jgi:hypothetical protein
VKQGVTAGCLFQPVFVKLITFEATLSTKHQPDLIESTTMKCASEYAAFDEVKKGACSL